MSEPCCACHRSNDEAVPSQVLGRSKSTWRSDELRQFFRLYGVSCCKRGTKDDLMLGLTQLSRERGLTIRSSRRILRLMRRGVPCHEIRERMGIASMASPYRPITEASKARPQQAVKPKLQMKEEINIIEKAEIECSICTETCSNDQIPPRRVTAGCHHSRYVCLACIRHSISTQLEVKMWHQLSCPCCEQLLSHQDVKDFGDPTVFERYEFSFVVHFMSLHFHKPPFCHLAKFANSIPVTTACA